MPVLNRKWILTVPHESLITLPSLPAWGLLTLLLLAAFAESLAFVGLVLPGVAILFALAFAAGSSGLDLGACLAVALIGALLGDGLSFWLGKHSAPRIRSLGLVQRHPGWLNRGERFFERWGVISILLGRFIGPLRPVIPFIAGSCQMPSSRFFAYNLLSGLGWAPLYLLPGYYAGRGLQVMPSHLTPLLWVLAVFLFIMLIWQQLHHRLNPDTLLSRRLMQLMPSTCPPAPLVMLISMLTLFVVSTALVLTPFGTSLNQMILPTLKALGALQPLPVLAVTVLGEFKLALGLALLTSLFGVVWLRQPQAWGVVLGTAFATGLNVLLKHLFVIDRPEQFTLTTYSFPSGHASTAAAWIGLVCVYWAHTRPHAVRHRAYLAAAPLILLVALSRCLLGVHWPLDVIAGVAEGLCIAVVYRIWLCRHPAEAPVPIGWLGVLAALVVAFMIWQLGPMAAAYRIS